MPLWEKDNIVVMLAKFEINLRMYKEIIWYEVSLTAVLVKIENILYNV